MSSFKELALNTKILDALEEKGYCKPSPIQEQAIPQILLGKDFLGIAQTGTGKTAAFSLPILHLLSEKKNGDSKNPRALILTPTRELASQIVDNVECYGKELHLTYAVIFGGVSDVEQIKTIKRGVDIIVATPGRLIDLMQQRAINLQKIEIFVLDEADRMLDMGFIVDVKRIVKQLPKQRQNLFFSATMPQAINKLSHEILHEPVIVEITPQATTVDRIVQKVFLVENSNKRLLLKEILQENDLKTVLVFCKTKRGANQLASFLDNNRINVSLIHGNKSQSAREKALQEFRDGKVKVLIATDIASRGIDIVGISHVVNYDMPLEPESYVHRIGRTARAGREGIAISFCDTLELKFLREVERTIGKKITIDDSRMFKESNSVSRKISEKKNNNKQQEIMTNNTNNKPQSQNNQSIVGRKISSAKNNHDLAPRNHQQNIPSSSEINENKDFKDSRSINLQNNPDEVSPSIDENIAKRADNNDRANIQGNHSQSRGREVGHDDSSANRQRPNHPNNRHRRPKHNSHAKEEKSLVVSVFKKIKSLFKPKKDGEDGPAIEGLKSDERKFSGRRGQQQYRDRNRNQHGSKRQSSRPSNRRQGDR
jgi:ATP-dependent RNA helicase RhlE